jgi:hypothetical protein
MHAPDPAATAPSRTLDGGGKAQPRYRFGMGAGFEQPRNEGHELTLSDFSFQLFSFFFARFLFCLTLPFNLHGKVKQSETVQRLESWFWSPALGGGGQDARAHGRFGIQDLAVRQYKLQQSSSEPRLLPLRLERCPSLAGAGEGGRRPDEGRWGKTLFCGDGRGEVSNPVNQKTEVNKNLHHQFLHKASLLIPAEFAETKTAAFPGLTRYQWPDPLVQRIKMRRWRHWAKRQRNDYETRYHSIKRRAGNELPG